MKVQNLYDHKTLVKDTRNIANEHPDFVKELKIKIK